MESSRFRAQDGAELAFHTVGSGRPLILLHGLMGSGLAKLELWVRLFVDNGHLVVVPDLRGHGENTTTHPRTAYPPDVLADDGLALIQHLGWADGEYDLGGYSLGARIVLRMLVRGARADRAVVVGQGLEKMTGPQGDASRQLLTLVASGAALEPGSREAQFADWVRKQGADTSALLFVLDSLVPTTEDALRRIQTPTLVAIGDADERSDADQLAALLPNGRFLRVPGNHETTFSSPELAEAMTSFLARWR
jgi:pimeloyl-ACP methyl ester carboxylesterase